MAHRYFQRPKVRTKKTFADEEAIETSSPGTEAEKVENLRRHSLMKKRLRLSYSHAQPAIDYSLRRHSLMKKRLRHFPIRLSPFPVDPKKTFADEEAIETRTPPPLASGRDP